MVVDHVFHNSRHDGYKQKNGECTMKKLLMLLIVMLTASPLFSQWEPVNETSKYYYSYVIKSNGGELFVGEGDNVYKSTDEGNTWINLTNNFIINAANSNTFIEFAGDNIFVGTSYEGVYMSPDKGATWQYDKEGLENVRQVDMLYSDGTKIFSSMGWPTYGLYQKSAVPGQWMRVNSNDIGTTAGTQVTGLTKMDNLYYACTRSSGVYESSDGENWTKKSNTDYPAEVASFAASFPSNRIVTIGSTLFIATADGIYKSADQAESWTRTDKGFAQWDGIGKVPIMKLYAHEKSLYATMGKDDSVYVSTDLGDSWADISDGLDHYIISLTVHNNYLYGAQWDRDSSLVRKGTTVGVMSESKGNIPAVFQLAQNYPNPFNPSTTIQYTIPASPKRNAIFVSLSVFNMLGKKVATLVNEDKMPGNYEVNFDASDLASGLYFYKLTVGQNTITKKMILLQ